MTFKLPNIVLPATTDELVPAKDNNAAVSSSDVTLLNISPTSFNRVLFPV